MRQGYTRGVSPAQRKIAFLVIGFLFLGLEISRRAVEDRIPDWIAFAIAGIALFRFGYSLQINAIANLKRFQFTLRTFVWLASVVAFWYSTMIWIWWSRRTPNFPLFLLNAELTTTLFFDWVPALILFGLALEARAERKLSVQ
jgi:cation transport ATPase